MAKKQTKPIDRSSRRCPSCGRDYDPTDRFCRQCGVSLTAGEKTNGGLRGLVGLRSFGLALIALGLLYAVIHYGGGAASEDVPAERISISDIGSGAPAATADPRAMADQLFNEALTAHETGDSARAHQFIPMALAAYAELAELDLDARYHVALLNLAAGQAGAALAQSDTMLAQVPEHLLALLAGARAYEQLGQSDQAAAYYERFLEAHTPEAAASRQEYLDHGRVLASRRQSAIEYLRARGRSP
jgi:tetratricopeptide (TPR) repeat protein